MYARLVMKPTTSFSANDWLNDVISVITGSITSANNLSNTIFNTSLSSIVTTVPAGWESYSNTAGATVGNTQPRVIRAPVSDYPSKYKYIWVGSMQLNANNAPHMYWIHGEDWDNGTNTGNNFAVAIPTTTNGVQTWYNTPSLYGGGALASAPLITIISSSANHLFICNVPTTVDSPINSYVYLTEYTRDDPWNTVSNGYTNWIMVGHSNPSNLTGASVVGRCNGTVPKIPINNASISFSNVNHLAAATGAGGASLTNWRIATRFRSDNASTIYPELAGFTSSGDYFGAQGYGRKADLSPAIPVSELFVMQGFASYGTHGIQSYGSITGKAPYVYATRTGLGQNLDELLIDGNAYTYIRTSIGTTVPATANNAAILIKQE